jgi:adenosylmethionine-8-amino-7-oxononanoate aminotransferase
LVEQGLVDSVRERGPSLLEELRSALESSQIVGEVRGRGFLLGVELVDPRDGESFLPAELDAASLMDDAALEHGLLVTSTHSQTDGFAGDQTLLAPGFVSSDEELTQMIERFTTALQDVEHSIKESLSGPGAGTSD